MAQISSSSNCETSTPLIYKQQDYDGWFGSSSLTGAVFSLSTAIVGAGIMSLPATMVTVGLIPGCILILLAALLTNTSIDFLLRYSSASKTDTYACVMANSFGHIGRLLLQLCIIISIFGILVVYLIIIADVLSGSTSSSVHHAGVLEDWAGGQTWWNTRTSVMLFTTVFVLAPLVSFRHVENLELSSALSVCLAVLFVVVAATIAIYKLAAGSVSMPNLFPESELNTSTVLNLFSVVPVLVTAYVCHPCVHPILNELKVPSDGKRAIQMSLVLCSFIYVSTSIFCYLSFGDDTLSDVLSNFDADLGVPHGELLSYIVRVGYAVHLMLVFPLLNFSLRLNLDELVFPRAVPLTLDARRFVLITTFLLVGSFTVACFVPDIWDVFQFTGSSSAVCLAFVFPGSLVIRDVRSIASTREKITAWFMVVLAAGASIIAVSGDVYGLLE